MKTKTAVITSISLLMCGLFALGACANQVKYNWSLTEIDSEVSFHTQAQADFLADNNYLYAGGKDANGNAMADGTAELSRPTPVHFSWSASPAKEYDITVQEYKVEISSNSNFTSALTYTSKTTELDVYNLYIATDYYWRVSALMSDGSLSNVSTVSTFTTADAAPRNIYVEGVTNMRDLGGWKIADGGRVKQGMIYRCGRLNESETKGKYPETDGVKIEITDEGIATMLNVLGIKSQIDLRTPENHNNETGGITSSPLGDDVTYINPYLEWDVGSKNILTYEENIPHIKDVFEFLADENNYPVIYHCNIGTDRTGMFAFLINGLLGVSEEDLYRDYLFSNFGYICYKAGDSPRTYAKLTAANGYVDIIKKYNGDTLSEKIENYLIDKIGVGQETLDSIKNLLTY